MLMSVLSDILKDCMGFPLRFKKMKEIHSLPFSKWVGGLGVSQIFLQGEGIWGGIEDWGACWKREMCVDLVTIIFEQVFCFEKCLQMVCKFIDILVFFWFLFHFYRNSYELNSLQETTSRNIIEIKPSWEALMDEMFTFIFL